MSDEEYEKFSSFMDALLAAERKKYQDQFLDDIIFGKHNTYEALYNNQYTKSYRQLLLHKTDELTIQYNETDKRYLCEYLPLGIVITIPASMLGVGVRFNSYYGIGMSSDTSHIPDLPKICSRIVFAIKNFGPTLNAICERIENDMNKKLDISTNIRYIREEEKVLPSPDWEIMERS